MQKSKSNPYVTGLFTANLSTSSLPGLPALQDDLPAGMQRIIIPKNHILTPHLHPDTNETTFCLSGHGKVGLITPDPSKNEPIGASFHESDFSKNSVVFLPQGGAHYFRNVGEEDLVLLLTFEKFDFNIITLADMFHRFPKPIAA